MQTKWIEAFLAVVDHQGFGAASTHLYRSQGRISNYIASLETELGVQLFDRTQRPARLTSEGAAFLPHARTLLETLDSGRSAALAVQGLARGDVTVATYPSASAEFLPHVLRRFSAHYPNVEVQLIVRPTRGLDSALYDGDTSIIIRPTIPPMLFKASVQQRMLWRERMCLVVPKGHALAGREQIEWNDLVGQPLVVGGPNSRDTELSRILLSVDGVVPTIKYLSDQPQTIVGLARSGLAVGITNALALQSVRLNGVVVIPLPAEAVREVGVYWSTATAGSPAATALLSTIVSTPAPATTVDLRDDAKHPDSGSNATRM